MKREKFKTSVIRLCNQRWVNWLRLNKRGPKLLSPNLNQTFSEVEKIWLLFYLFNFHTLVHFLLLAGMLPSLIGAGSTRNKPERLLVQRKDVLTLKALD